MNRLLARTITAAAAAAVLGASGLSGLAVAGISVHAAGRSNYTTWRVIYRTRAGLGPAAATGPRQVWVLASTASDNYLLRWNGSAWRKMQPMPSGFGASVFSPFLIKASGPSDIWVFGNVSDPYTHPEAIVWNGRSWRPVTPQLPATEVGGSSVGDGDAVVTSPTDVWYTDGSDLFHWNGTAWTDTAFAMSDPFTTLAATPGGTVWRLNSVPSNGHYRPVAQTWNGARWRAVKLPRLAIRQVPISLSIWSAHDIWMGMVLAGPYRRIILHWNGSRWRRINVPSYAIDGDVTAAGPDRVWVSGTALWNGSAWLFGASGGNGVGMTGIPGTRSAVFPMDRTNDRRNGEIWLNGTLP
jgi:hypothetical protein